MLHGPYAAHALQADNVKAMLVSLAFQPDRGLEFRDQIVDELVAPGYTSGGVDVTGFTATFDPGLGTVSMLCDSVVFPEMMTSDIGGIVFYVDSGDPATDRLIFTDVVDPVDVASEELTYVLDSNGALVTAYLGY